MINPSIHSFIHPSIHPLASIRFGHPMIRVSTKTQTHTHTSWMTSDKFSIPNQKLDDSHMFSNPFFSFVIKWIYMGIHHVEQYNDTRWLPTQLQMWTDMCRRVYSPISSKARPRVGHLPQYTKCHGFILFYFMFK